MDDSLPLSCRVVFYRICRVEKEVAMNSTPLELIFGSCSMMFGRPSSGRLERLSILDFGLAVTVTLVSW